MTSLILSLIEAPTGIPLETRCIDADHYSLGRDPGNDWILADPYRRISRHHCLISRQGDGWVLSDLSRNGVLHESDHGAIAGAERSLRLISGDRLRVGDYEISVTVQDDESSFRIMPLPDFVAALRQNIRSQPPAPPAATRSSSRRTPTQPPLRRREAMPVEAPQRDDPLLALLGLGGGSLSPGRRSVALFRLGAALDAALRGMRRLMAGGRGDAAAPVSPLLQKTCGKHEALGWIAGTAGLPDGGPVLSAERLVGDAFDDIECHQICLDRAYRRCMRDIMNALDPDLEEEGGDVEAGAKPRRRSLSTIRQRHRLIRAQLEDGFEQALARAYRQEMEALKAERRFSGSHQARPLRSE